MIAGRKGEGPHKPHYIIVVMQLWGPNLEHFRPFIQWGRNHKGIFSTNITHKQNIARFDFENRTKQTKSSLLEIFLKCVGQIKDKIPSLNVVYVRV